MNKTISVLKNSAPAEFEVIQTLGRLVQQKEPSARVLLVGGCVRDALLGHGGHDFDVEVHGIEAAPLYEILKANWRLDEVGAAFGIIKLHHFDIDIALPRRENCRGSGHRDFAIATDPHLGVREAAARRDFTLNAIYLDPLSGEILDPWNGVQDLQAGVLRHVSEHFIEDPLRVLRAMQFVARFGLCVAPETLLLCSQMTQEALPRERLAAEWEKLFLKGKAPSLGLNFLRECGWVRFYPELEALIGCKQTAQFHPEGDVWTHTLLGMDAMTGLRDKAAAAVADATDEEKKRVQDDNLVRMLAILCHDFGKPRTSVMDPETGKVTSYTHETSADDLVRDFILRLWNQKDIIHTVTALVRTHMRPIALVTSNATNKSYRRLSVEAERLDLLCDVVECDLRGTLCANATLELLASFKQRIHELSIEKKPPTPLVLGRHLVERGLRPGSEFKPILDRCYEAQLDGEFGSLDAALAFLDEVLANAEFGIRNWASRYQDSRIRKAVPGRT